MYIPVMSLVTYIFLQALISGLKGQFQPELFGYIATIALVAVVVEILGLKLGCYLLSISNESQLLDLVAYSGYKFVGVIVTISVAEIVNGGKGTGGWIGWAVFIYTFLANSLFLVSDCPAVSTWERSRVVSNMSSRCAHSSTCSCRRIITIAGGRCRPCTPWIRGPRGTNAPSSSFSTHIPSSSSSCGSSAGHRWLVFGFRFRQGEMEAISVPQTRGHGTRPCDEGLGKGTARLAWQAIAMFGCVGV